MSIYVVRKGDTISEIAEMFGVSTNTILWANDLTRGSKIKEGDILLILPVSGVRHEVKKGETLKSIAEKYKADPDDIARFNGLPTGAKLVAGDEMIVPGGETDVDGPVFSNSSSSSSSVPSNAPGRALPGFFINPVPGAIRTQKIHGKNGVDLAAPIGTPIYASASGTVLIARDSGWNGGYGKMTVIEHENGTRTLYSHLSKVLVASGQDVKQGELIGRVGNTGRVRASPGGNGAHLHFEVHGAQNPGATTPMSFAR